jgi:RNA 2',3'-cyclic 3'-phosphodiesterase
MHRLFVAIDLPDHIKAELDMMEVGMPGVNWVSEESRHITLFFIGEVDGGLYREIQNALYDVTIDPFDLVLEGVGHFPPRGEPTVLWVGVEKNESLIRLRNRVENALVGLGIEPDKRKYAPHVTLARLRNAPISGIGAFLTRHAQFKTEPFDVTEFQLFSSKLTSKGAVYTVEEVYSLEEPEDEDD